MTTSTNSYEKSNDIRPFGPYSTYRKAGESIWTAGFVGMYADRTFPEGGFEGQMRIALANMMAVLNDAGAEPSDIVATNVFLADRENAGEMNRIYREYFTDPLPVRTTVTVMLSAGVLFEINAIAIIGSGSTA